MIKTAAPNIVKASGFNATASGLSGGGAFVLLIGLAWLILYTIPEPPLAFVLIDFIFCGYIASQFKYRRRFLFLLHPFALVLIWQFYTDGVQFQTLGDGEAYFAVVRSSLPYYTGGAWEDVVDIVQNYNFTGLYFGMIPNILIPDVFFDNPPDSAYFFWQPTFFVILMSGLTLLARTWAAIDDRKLYALVLFAIISPSFLENTAVPHRHYVTFCFVFLTYIALEALFKRFGILKLVMLILAILGIVVSKAGYVVPIAIYVVLRLWRAGLVRSRHLVFLMPLAAFGFFLPFVLDMISGYAALRQSNVASAGFASDIPVLSEIFKVIAALLAPFPWLKFADHLLNYGGNGLLFLLHIASSLTGIYFIILLIRKWKGVMGKASDYRPITLYGLVMSSSILWGAAGFHGYLSIFFPFFAPLLLERRFKISVGYSIAFVLLAEMLYWAL